MTEQLNFKSIGTSNSTQTLECETLPTVAQLQNLVLECTLGYYGGAINGATVYVEYDIPSAGVQYYTYTYVVDGDATIAVTIGSTGDSQLYVKENGTWAAYSALYKKVNGSWVVVDPDTELDTNANYVWRN